MKLWKYIFSVLTLIFVLLILALFQLPDGNLHIIACDVGQGDAILVTYKNIQILTDGGPDDKVIDCLGRHMPFWDREIELVVSTHPDSDHSTGLIDVVKKYNVDKILINPIDPGTQVIKALESAVGGRGVGVINPVAGMSLGLSLIHLDIVNPSSGQNAALNQKAEDSSLGFYVPVEDTNAYSIVYKLSFGQFTGLFLGDIPAVISDQLSVNSSVGTVDYIKIPHHGSKNGLTENLLKTVMPEGGLHPGVGVISVGAKNIWGFPSPEILTMLKNYNVKVLRTDLMGDVEVITDGDKFWTI